MKNISPKCASTKILADIHVWIPADFNDFLVELDHIISSCFGDNPYPLFRGHSDSTWILDSTFARTCKNILFDTLAYEIPNEIKYSLEFNNHIQILHLLKYGVFCPSTSELENVAIKLSPYLKDVICRPHEGLEKVANAHDVDPWFELMKRIQQFPEEDHPYLKGSFFIDWTQSKDVALYFANYDNDSERTGDGALFICDKVITGKTLMRDKNGSTITVSKILDLMSDKINKGEPTGCPVIFYPPKQIKYSREANQQVVYFAQMDLRCSLEEQWKLKEKEINELIYIKLILPEGAKNECHNYLRKLAFECPAWKGGDEKCLLL